MLKKAKERYEMAFQGLGTGSMPKVNFNHVFSEVKRESEFNNIAKMFKGAMKNKETKAGSFCAQNTNNGGASVGSNYMQVTHSWANKNKPTGGNGSSSNVVPPSSSNTQ